VLQTFQTTVAHFPHFEKQPTPEKKINNNNDIKLKKKMTVGRASERN
jgi:hypothetical protein